VESRETFDIFVPHKNNLLDNNSMLKLQCLIGIAFIWAQLNILQISPLKQRVPRSAAAEGCSFDDPAKAYPADPLVKLDPQITKYYHYINLAARAIYINDFRTAATCYDSAFLFKKHPFFVDLKNYIIVNSKCAAYEKNGPAIQMLFSAKKCDTASLFQALPKRIFNAENLSLINKLQAKFRWNNQPETNCQKTIRELYDIDQALLLDFGGFNMLDRECAKEYYAKQDSVGHDNCVRFIAFCKQNGFPSEEDLGIYDAQNEERGNMVYMLLWNFISSKNLADREAILPIIKQAIQDGNLHHSRGACLFDLVWNNSKVKDPGYDFLNTTIELLQGDAYRPFVIFNDSLMREVNTNRVSIGLDSFHIVQKQVICKYFGAKKTAAGENFLGMAHYSNISDGVPLGFVKMAAQQANIDLSTYKIKTEKILGQCNCAEKVY